MKQRVPDTAAGERLDRFLASLAEIGSRGVAERLLESGGVLVDGRRQGKSHRLTGGDIEELLNEQRVTRHDYERRHPEDVAVLEALVAAAERQVSTTQKR